MVAAAVGMQVRGWYPFVSTFAAFLTRAVRLRPHGRGQPGPAVACAVRTPACRSARTARRRWGSRTSPRCGPSTAAPCCTRATATRPSKLVAAMADVTTASPTCARLRADTPVIYGPDDDFEIGGSKVVRSSDDDVATVVAAGITVHEALKAADALAADGIAVRVVDAYSVKPIDADGLHEPRPAPPTAGSSPSRTTGPRAASARRCCPPSPATRHLPTVVKLAVPEMPTSGKPGRAAGRRRHRRRGHRRRRPQPGRRLQQGGPHDQAPRPLRPVRPEPVARQPASGAGSPAASSSAGRPGRPGRDLEPDDLPEGDGRRARLRRAVRRPGRRRPVGRGQLLGDGHDRHRGRPAHPAPGPRRERRRRRLRLARAGARHGPRHRRQHRRRPRAATSGSTSPTSTSRSPAPPRASPPSRP